LSLAVLHGKILFMRTYELVLVVKPSITEPGRKKVLETVTSWLPKVKVVKEDDWGSKALKYKIKKELTGHFYDLHLEVEGSIPTDFEKRVLMQDEVLRHLLVRTK
jgi:small subunit ribosomal protein S6